MGLIAPSEEHLLADHSARPGKQHLVRDRLPALVVHYPSSSSRDWMATSVPEGVQGDHTLLQESAGIGSFYGQVLIRHRFEYHD